jgi:glucan phosphoethanolaminetransferase (alkaline phosphatase superfamily)
MKLLEGLGLDYKDRYKRFYVLHQRGSHGPYALRYPKDKAVFPISGDYKADRVNHYDNSVLEFDRFMERLITKIKASNRPTIMLYVSDHGEGLGEDGVWGHAALKKPSFSIPVLGYFHKTDIRPNFSAEPTHLEVSMFITKLLGFDSDLKFPMKNYQVLGNDMDGFAGYVDLEFDESGKLINYVRKDI